MDLFDAENKYKKTQELKIKHSATNQVLSQHQKTQYNNKNSFEIQFADKTCLTGQAKL